MPPTLGSAPAKPWRSSITRVVHRLSTSGALLGHAARALAIAILLLASGAGPGAAAPATARTASAPSFITHHLVEAEVSRVDRDSGLLLLKTDAGRLKLEAPRAVVATLRKGDAVLVDIVLIRHPDPARIPHDPGDPRPLFVERLAAQVTAIQRSMGIVMLNTAAGRLTIDLPAPATAGLRPGDRLPLDLAVRRESDVSAMPGAARRNRRAGLAGLLFLIFGRGK